MKHALLILPLLSLSCSHALRELSEDHAIQTQAILDKCEKGYPEAPCSDELREDMEAMRDQAVCIAEFAAKTQERCGKR